MASLVVVAAIVGALELDALGESAVASAEELAGAVIGVASAPDSSSAVAASLEANNHGVSVVPQMEQLPARKAVTEQGENDEAFRS